MVGSVGSEDVYPMARRQELSHTERSVMQHIRERSSLSMNEIAEYLRQTKGWSLGETSLLMERLIRRGYVLRDPNGTQERYVALPGFDADSGEHVSPPPVDDSQGSSLPGPNDPEISGEG